MSTVHNVIKLSAGKITSRDLGYKHICFKAKDRKRIADRNFTPKHQISEVQLTAKKEMFIDMEDMSESRMEGDKWVDVDWGSGDHQNSSITPFFSWTGKI